jgi:hypothetical protein
MGDMGAGSGMLIVETIAKIRRAHFAQKKPIKAIWREFGVSRKVVRKVIRSGATEFRYERGKQPLPRIDPWRGHLDGLLLANEGKAARHRDTGPAATILTPEALQLRHAPLADCARYDRLRRVG